MEKRITAIQCCGPYNYIQSCTNTGSRLENVNHYPARSCDINWSCKQLRDIPCCKVSGAKLNQPDASTKELIRTLIKSLNMPILFSGLTTVAGILGLLTHSIITAKQVGVLAASGVSLALLMSLLLIPALILVSGSRLISKKRKKIKPGSLTPSLPICQNI